MRSADEVQVVFGVELPDDILSEGEADTSVVVAVLLDATLWVGPQQVAEEPGVGHVGGSHDILDLLEVSQLGREAAVHAENFLVDEGSYWQAVEDVAEDFPEPN